VRIGSLFSGYGGLDMAVSSVLGGQVAWHVEYDKAPSRILAHHYPTVPNHGDVTQVDFTTIEPVDVLTGGYPCQPFSHAGLRKGTDDDRHLWPHVLRAIREMGPRLAILENVRGHLSLGFDVVLADLADLGWSARWGVVRASDADAPHQRARLFILAYPDLAGSQARGAQPRRARGQEAHAAPRGGSPTPDSRRERHGAGQDGRGLGRLDRQDESGSRQRQRPRQVTRDRGTASTPDAGGERLQRPPIVGQLGGQRLGVNGQVHWGDYGPAIARWESAIGRPAPAPTEPGRTGAPRLAPRFVEWMMGLPDGHVTDPAIGISRNDQLKALGNGVVPQQAALALRHLLAA
jgi:DNA (cytosine-5)-methyltransferase 1